MKFIFKELTFKHNIMVEVLNGWGEHGYYVVGFNVEQVSDGSWSANLYRFIMQKQVEEYFEEQANE